MPTRRLKKGVTLEQAGADVTRMIPILRAQYGPAPGRTRASDRTFSTSRTAWSGTWARPYG